MQKEVGVSVSCKDGGVLPDIGFPRVSGMEASDNSDTVQTRAFLTTHMHSFTGVAPVVIRSKGCVFVVVQVRRG